MFLLMTKIFPEFSKEGRPGSRNRTVEDLTKFLFSKHKLVLVLVLGK